MEKSKNEVKAWLSKADRSLKVAEKMLEDQFFPEVIVRSYYAMFYAARGFLTKGMKVKVTKHSGVIAILGKDYVKTDKLDKKFHKFIINAFKWRQKADYELYWEADRELSEQIFNNANDFVLEIKKKVEEN